MWSQSSRSEDKARDVQRGPIWSSAQNTNLEVVLLGFAPHDDVERLVRVLGAALNAAGHVLLILVRVEPHAECSVVSSQLGLRVGSCTREVRRSIIIAGVNLKRSQIQNSLG